MAGALEQRPPPIDKVAINACYTVSSIPPLSHYSAMGYAYRVTCHTEVRNGKVNRLPEVLQRAEYMFKHIDLKTCTLTDSGAVPRHHAAGTQRTRFDGCRMLRDFELQWRTAPVARIRCRCTHTTPRNRLRPVGTAWEQSSGQQQD
jgi:hypothetical protein